jgi:hypothetical protein
MKTGNNIPLHPVRNETIGRKLIFIGILKNIVMKKKDYWQLLVVAVFSLATISCASPSITKEEWSEIGVSVTSSMKFYIAVDKTESQAQERRKNADIWSYEKEECVYEIREATLKHLVNHFVDTSEWEAIPTIQQDFDVSEVWALIKDAIPAASKQLGNSAILEQVKWTIDNVAKEYGRLNRVEFKLPEFVSKTKDREVFKSYCTHNDTYYEIIRTSDGGYLWDFSMPYF